METPKCMLRNGTSTQGMQGQTLGGRLVVPLATLLLSPPEARGLRQNYSTVSSFRDRGKSETRT